MSDVEDTIDFFERCVIRGGAVDNSYAITPYFVVKDKEIDVRITGINVHYNYPETRTEFDVSVVGLGNILFSSFPPPAYFVFGDIKKTRVPCFIDSTTVTLGNLMNMDFRIIIENGQFVKPNITKKVKKIVTRADLLDI